MATTYRSKIDTWLLVVLAVAIGVCVLAGVGGLLSRAPGIVWMLVPTLVIGMGLPVWIMVSTRYTLDAHHLVAQSGPFKWRVPIGDITSVTPTRNPLSSPALSLDRLRIDYGQGRWIMISPREKERFLRELEGLRKGAAS